MPHPGKSAVYITGCSTGIGHAAALDLARHGYLVFANVRQQADADALRAAAGPDIALEPILADITDHGAVQNAVSKVRSILHKRYKTRKLVAVINNAGVTALGSLEDMSMDMVLDSLDIY